MSENPRKTRRLLTRAMVHPSPTSEETAAIMAALEVFRDNEKDAPPVKRSRWRLAGLLGHPAPPGMDPEGLWSYRGWEGQV